MAKKTFADFTKRMAQLGDATVKVGVLASAGTTPEGIPLTEIAAVHEFGSKDGRIPERSFIRSTFRRNRDAQSKFMAPLIKKVMRGSLDPDRALGLLGMWMVAKVRETIVNRGTEGPENQDLKPATIARKGSSTPLIDSGQLKNSISYEILHGGKK